MVCVQFLISLLILVRTHKPVMLQKNIVFGGRVVRAHAINAADSSRRSFAACHIPLSLPYFLSVNYLIKVSMPEKI